MRFGRVKHVKMWCFGNRLKLTLQVGYAGGSQNNLIGRLMGFVGIVTLTLVFRLRFDLFYGSSLVVEEVCLLAIVVGGWIGKYEK